MNEATEKKPVGRPPKSGEITPKSQRIDLVEVVFKAPVELDNAPMPLRRVTPDVPLNPGFAMPVSYTHLTLPTILRV